MAVARNLAQTASTFILNGCHVTVASNKKGRNHPHRPVEATPPHLRTILVVALNTGMRRSELLGLKWESIDFTKKVITIERSKSAEVNHPSEKVL